MLLASAFVAVTTLPSQASDAPPDFENEIAPILIKRCVECHQEPSPAGNLLLTSREGMLDGGDSGAVIDFESPEFSYLLERVHSGDMPPEERGQPRKLPAAEIDLLERWIASQAEWPEGRTLDWFERTTEVRAGRDWWSLQPIVRPDVPQLHASHQPANPIDAFIMARLEAARMAPAPPADKRTLLRRLYYDVIGLPPTAEQIESFVADSSPDAWERAVDQVLESPHYGERWGRYWLDLVRYADTSGYERDQEKPYAWKYRDWVVRAFNEDLPYDQFIIHQLAGDELPDRDEQSVVATGFLRLGPWNDEPNEPLDYQYERLEDLVHATSSAFLGLTVKCARCHAHKFDPITQEDYYRMGAAFWAGPIAPRDRELLGGPSEEELGYEKVLGWTDVSRDPPPLHMLKNGERQHPIHEVTPATLSIFPPLERAFDPPPESAKTSQRRLQLAHWIAHPQNPLPPRVMANRLWLHHFGEGIVRSPNNFGFLADPPTHPELLDWLAAELVSGGWTLKRMHRLILTSKTWQQSSLHPRFAEYEQKDAANRLWWRAERRRLDAEALRDSLLAVAGDIDLRLGGPGFRPEISAEALEGLSMKSGAWIPSEPDERRRRSLYLFSKRALLLPMMTNFDLCDATQPCGQRDVTTLPTQALTMLNNPFVHEQSERIGLQIASGSSDTATRVQELWRRVYGRSPSDAEQQLAAEHIARQAKRFEEAQRWQRSQESDPPEAEQQRTEKSLVLHLRAGDGVTIDTDGRVTAWQDLSGRRHHASQSVADRRPRFERDGFAGQAALSFDGDGEFLHVEGTLLEDAHCTVVAVVNDRALSGHREIISNWDGAAGNATTSLFLGLTGESSVRFSDAFSAEARSVSRGAPFIITAVSGSDQVRVSINGQIQGAMPNGLPPRNLSTPWVIGQQGNIDGEYWRGGIAEIRVYDRALSEVEHASIVRELSHRYSISVKDSSMPRPSSPDAMALASLAHVLLNSNEFLYVD